MCHEVKLTSLVISLLAIDAVAGNFILLIIFIRSNYNHLLPLIVLLCCTLRVTLIHAVQLLTIA